ncbi:hypothetical protein WJX75_006561 [Coccomyxa subellipsoidea]|uniref:Syndetin C-terminal domain-containing protein n=1 Tax=Coccomyxa subellipsoidea TaxID=248742 RepID=A0ABR2YBK3_9CHLO
MVQVLEGYIFLGNVSELGARLSNAFTSSVSSTVRQVVRSVILTRPGLEESARAGAPVQDMVRGVPADLFRTCLARALMVVTSSKGSQALRLARSMGQAGVRRLGSDEEGQPLSVESFIEALAAKDALAELQGLEWREAEEVEWGDVLRVSQRGMWASRGFLWEEAARNVACLLACPAAWDGDHFLQVSEWVQRILEAGNAFAGPDGAAGNFFAAYHSENLEGLHGILDKELWRRIPSGNAAEAGGLWQGLRGDAKLQKGGADSFDKILAAGNPWRRKHLRRRLARQGSPAVSFQLGFGGASALEEDRAAQKLEVDEHGIARRMSDDIWSNATSRRTSAATTHAVLSDDEEDELLSGDSLWEDDREAAKAEQEASSAEKQPSGGMPLTNSALKLVKWMQVYGELLRSLRPAPFVYRGMCELFEMFLVHVFVAFSDVSLADLLDSEAAEMADRRAASVAAAAPPSAAAALAQLSGSPSTAPKLSYSGNQWGLQERVVAASSLEAFAEQLRQGKSAIQALLPAAEHPSLDAFFTRTVDAAGDVSDCLLRCGARLNFNLAATAPAISGQFWDLSQPPMQASRWVEGVCRQAAYFSEKLAQVAGLTEHHRSQAFFLTGVEELGQWAVTHPEYTREQQLSLATAVAQFNGLKRKDQAVFVAQVEAFLL